MAVNHKDRRLSQAVDLQKELEALYALPQADRRGFVHDRIAAAVDDSCGTGRTFTAAQKAALKSIAFQIVYVVDARNKAPKGFFVSIWKEFSALPVLGKLGAVSAIFTFIIGLCVGVVNIADRSIAIYEKVNSSQGKEKTQSAVTAAPNITAPNITAPVAAAANSRAIDQKPDAPMPPKRP